MSTAPSSSSRPRLVVAEDEGSGAPDDDIPSSIEDFVPPAAPPVPIHTVTFLRQFVAVEAERLRKRSVSLCRALGIDDFAPDAVQQTVLRLLARGAPIVDVGPESALRYALVVLRRVCVDERRHRNREDVAIDSADANGAGDDSLERLSAEVRPDLAAALDARKIGRAALCCFELLPSYVGASQPSAAANLQAFWLACVEGASDDEVARALGLERANRTMRARGKRLLLGWLHALCEASPCASDDNATYRSAWEVGFEAGRAFVADYPGWWVAEGLPVGRGAGGHSR
jgi:hypothetical protein